MLWTIGPFFLFAMSAGAYRVLSKAAYNRGLNEFVFGGLGAVATLMAGTLGYVAGAALDPKDTDLAGMFFGGMFFLPMEALYIGAIYAVIKICPADAGEMAYELVDSRAATGDAEPRAGDQRPGE